jgi:hypothetical protein
VQVVTVTSVALVLHPPLSLALVAGHIRRSIQYIYLCSSGHSRSFTCCSEILCCCVMSSSLSPLQQPFKLQSFSSSEPRCTPEHLDFSPIATPSTSGPSHPTAESHLQRCHQSHVGHPTNHEVFNCTLTIKSSRHRLILDPIMLIRVIFQALRVHIPTLIQRSCKLRTYIMRIHVL